MNKGAKMVTKLRYLENDILKKKLNFSDPLARFSQDFAHFAAELEIRSHTTGVKS